MNCPECGEATRRNFCTKCGARLDASGAHMPSGSADERRAGQPSSATALITHRDLREMLAKVAAEEQASQAAIVDARRPVAETVTVTHRAVPATVASASHESTAVVLASNDTEPASSTPVEVEFRVPQQHNRLWAIPLLGFVAKCLMLVPHLAVVAGLNIVAGFVQLAAWVPVLRGGPYPAWAARWTGGWLRWQARAAAYFFGLVDEYPPFSLENVPDYPVQVRFTVPPHGKRLWAVPLIGYPAKLVLLIPHLVVLYALTLLAAVLQLVLWAWVLFNGTLPNWAYRYVGGSIRYQVRVQAYLLGLNDTYPPFQLG